METVIYNGHRGKWLPGTITLEVNYFVKDGQVPEGVLEVLEKEAEDSIADNDGVAVWDSTSEVSEWASDDDDEPDFVSYEELVKELEVEGK